MASNIKSFTQSHKVIRAKKNKDANKSRPLYSTRMHVGAHTSVSPSAIEMYDTAGQRISYGFSQTKVSEKKKESKKKALAREK